MAAKIKVRRTVPDWIKNILKDLEDKNLFFWDENTGAIVFYHDFCGGKLIPHQESPELRVCSKCRKTYPSKFYRTAYSAELLAVIFVPGIAEDYAKKLLSSLMAEVVEIKKDENSPHTIAVIIKTNRLENSPALSQFINKLESDPKIRAVLPMPIS